MRNAVLVALILVPGWTSGRAEIHQTTTPSGVAETALTYFQQVEGHCFDEFLHHIRPSRLSPDVKERILRILPQADIVDASAGQQAKLRALARILRYHDRESAIDGKLLPRGHLQSEVPALDRVGLRVRVYVDRGLDHTTVERAQEVARRLLAAAGIDMTWRLCDPTCDTKAEPSPEVIVILSRQALTGRQENCGRAAVGGRPGRGTVRVSVACVAAVAARVSIRREGPLHPLLVMARHDDLVGTVEAHEIGHVLGLKHGSGLMRARLDPADIVALRLGKLAFDAAEGSRMRMLLAPSAGPQVPNVWNAVRRCM